MNAGIRTRVTAVKGRCLNPLTNGPYIIYFHKKSSNLTSTANLEPYQAPPGFEPGIEVLQTFALPLGYGAKT